MSELVFLVKGSTPKPYEVTFFKDGASLTALCTCPAGEYGNLCKHRVAILDGKTASISGENAGDVPTVVEWLKGTDVEAALNELRVAEKDKDRSKDDVMALKKKLAKVMNT